MKKWVCLLLLLLISGTGISQKVDFLPTRNLWETQSLDPVAAQSLGHIAAVWENSHAADYTITTFAFGFQKSIITWKGSKENRYWDLGVEGAVFTQFEWKTTGGEMQRNMLSVDYMVGIPLVWTNHQWSMRVRIFHLSAHMGDDYMLRNKIDSYYKNNNNFEQLDVTALYTFKHFQFGLGLGTILRASQPREPFVMTGSADYSRPLNTNECLHFYGGMFIKSEQEHDFSPAVNMGIGLKFGKEERRPIKVLFTYYYGPLPYSVYIGKPVQWLGAAFFMNPF